MDWSEVRTALEELMALPAPEREARLASIAQRDPGLSAELATLLDHDRAATESTRGFLEPTPVPGTARSVGGGLHAGDEVEGFRIVARLGAGGMGTVWEATQKSPARRVALKTLGTDAQGWSHAERWRFEHEAAVLASLRHPAIAQVYAVGCARAGDEEVPWFALELVEDARDLTTWAAEEHASRAERLRLFTQLCEAVQHGHQRGVIHRDLKPSNILVDREGHVKLIDFGVARALEGSTQTAAMRTRAGELVGTLQYMAPEQFDAGGPELDVRCDIYALGVVLYQLLCGRLPFDFTGASLTEIARIVREEDPRRPSRSDGGLEGDLEWILLKALAKEPGRRYASVGALIEDLRRSASDEPVLAGPPSKAYRFSKFVRRNRVLVATSSALLVGLLLATGGVVLGLFEARAAEKRARTEEGLAKTARNEAEHQKGIADTQATLAREERDRASREAQKRGLVLELVEGMFPDVEDTVAGREVRVVDMLDAAVLDFDGQVARDPEVEYSFRRMLGTTFHRLRLFDRSAAQLERALELEGELPEESIGDDALLGHVFLGAAWTRTGREEEGEALLRETLAEADRVGFGEAQLGARNYLLVFLSNRGAFEEALELSSEMQALAAEQGDVVRELNALNLHANALRQLSRFEEAMPVCEEAFLRFEELEGPYSHHTITTGLNHAGNLFQTGRLEEAAELYPELLDRAAEVMGADSDLTLGNRESYALLLHTMGERERSTEILLEVVDAYEQRNRPTLYHVLALRSLGLMYRRSGADDQAESYLRLGVELGEGFLAEDNFYLATLRQAHGCCLVALGRSEEGEEILTVAWGTIEASLPPKHPRRAEWIAEIASAYEKQGRAQDAARWREHLGP